MNNEFDATRLSLLLNDLRLPAVKQIWPNTRLPNLDCRARSTLHRTPSQGGQTASR